MTEAQTAEKYWHWLLSGFKGLVGMLEEFHKKDVPPMSRKDSEAAEEYLERFEVLLEEQRQRREQPCSK
jgi:hypothetical protein